MRNFERLAGMPEEKRIQMVLDLWESNRNINGFFNMLMSEAEPTAIEMMEALDWKVDNNTENGISFFNICGGWLYMSSDMLNFAQQILDSKRYTYSIDEIHEIEKAYAKLKQERGWE